MSMHELFNSFSFSSFISPHRINIVLIVSTSSWMMLRVRRYWHILFRIPRSSESLIRSMRRRLNYYLILLISLLVFAKVSHNFSNNRQFLDLTLESNAWILISKNLIWFFNENCQLLCLLKLATKVVMREVIFGNNEWESDWMKNSINEIRNKRISGCSHDNTLFFVLAIFLWGQIKIFINQ